MKQLNLPALQKLPAFTLLTLLFFLFATGIPHLIFAAENYKPGDKLYVAPTTGLNIRTQPSLQAPTLAKLQYNSTVTILTEPTETEQIQVSDFNGGKLNLQGNWVKVKAGEVTGYVFDGMLSRYKGLALGNHNEELYFATTFGQPKTETIAKSKMEQGHKVDYETEIRTYPNGLIEETTVYDGCPDVKYTFSLPFNEAYWLISRMMLDADAVQDIKINKTDKATVLTFYSCS
jgi:hypothetical protein